MGTCVLCARARHVGLEEPTPNKVPEFVDKFSERLKEKPACMSFSEQFGLV